MVRLTASSAVLAPKRRVSPATVMTDSVTGDDVTWTGGRCNFSQLAQDLPGGIFSAMRISDMNWMQVEAFLKNDDRAVLPIGSTEQHSYLRLTVDCILPEK